MYVLTVELEIIPENSEDFREVIERQAKTSVEREDGCLTFDVWRSQDEPNRFLLHEIYSDREAFDIHMDQQHSKENGAKTKPWIRSQVIRFWKKPGDY